MKYTLCTWEENGYHDSDFLRAVWNTETNAVESELTGSTRFAGVPCEQLPNCTPEIAERAVAWLADYLTPLLIGAEKRDIFEPQAVPKAGKLMLSRNVSWKDKRNGGEKIEAKAGEIGRVFWEGAFGTFYRNGYNKRDRSNIRVGLEFSDGRKLFTGLKYCRKPEDPLSDSELRTRALRLARECQFGKALSSRHAWDSTNEASSALKQTQAIA